MKTIPLSLARALRRPGSLLLLLLGLAGPLAAAPVVLFDGKSLEGWEGNTNLWRVKDGLIVGGSLEERVPRNEFIATKKSYHNFELRVKLKLSGTEGFINSGVQIRSVRVPNNSEMSGYQVDYGKGWYGKIYDESRRNKVIAEAADMAAATAAIKEGDWNEYRIRAEGPRIRSWINGVPALDYTEADANIAQDGQIGIQVHGGGKALVEIKEVVIEELPATPDAPTWEKVGRPQPPAKKAAPPPKKEAAKAAPDKVQTQMAVAGTARTPEEERQAFKLPEGFVAELVAAESEGIGKFITAVWDARMRLWTMTALEYPVDANENPEASRQLFEKGGRDQVIVFDNPYGKQVQPRSFARGLVMPLGLLPYRDGAFVQYGSEVRFYRDADADGKAEGFETVLNGFGTQDSHLFPHQFTRVPGGSILLAQGLFNYSTVRRPDGKMFADGTKEVVFNQCKLARFAPDGSVFENLTSGPNNIWGLTIGREGETWIQEANDIGCPIIPYEPGILVRTGSKEKLRPYQPLMPPPLDPPQMGGTGLSGLALADDRGTPFQKAFAGEGDAKIFYLANPITSTIQIIKATPEGPRYRYEKLPDFLVSSDPWFRPVAVGFGPDGCLYITDWYNKIISHNEVPRTHPDRDKTRGRIWRVRHRDQPRVIPPDLTKVLERDLPAHLDHDNAVVARLAWQEIVDRKAVGLISDLERIIRDKTASAGRRCGALWALEGLGKVSMPVLQAIARDSNSNLRHESLRIAAAQGIAPKDFIPLAAPLVDDPQPKVRAALGDALRRIANPDAGIIELAAQLGREPLTGTGWPQYEREFERYLARWAMEKQPSAVAAFLNSPRAQALPLENRLLATLSLSGRDSAIGLARLMPDLKRPLQVDEVRTLAAHFNEPAVATALEQSLASPASQAPTLKALLALRTSLDATKLAPAIATAAKAIWDRNASEADRQLALEVAGAFRLTALEKDIARALSAGMPPAMVVPALRALREMNSAELEPLVALAQDRNQNAAIRNEALAALAASRHERAPAALLELWPVLDATARRAALERLAATKPGAEMLLTSLRAGKIDHDEAGYAVLEKMHTLLAGNPEMESLWRGYAGTVQRVLRLDGKANSYAETKVDLIGPFTVEAWVKLDPGISNDDGILGAPGTADFNFFGGHFRIYGGPNEGDRIVARKAITADTWTHVAATRNERGEFKIYINGELDNAVSKPLATPFRGLDVGRVTPQKGGTAGWITEFRAWNIERSPEDIRASFDRSFGKAGEPKELARLGSGANGWGQFRGTAQLASTQDFPTLLNEEQARAQESRFAQFRKLAGQPGSLEQGRHLFTTVCLMCHNARGQGAQIAPALDGIGLTGTEAMLRNILTPNAAMEGGYRKFRVETHDGELMEGLLISQDASGIVLRQPNAADQKVPTANVKKAGYTKFSLMPEGLLEGLSPADVSALFTYLKSLK